MLDATERIFAAIRAEDVDALRSLLADGANPRLSDGTEVPLHAAARRGSLALVEALLEGGALEWQTDARGQTPLDIARRGRGRDRAAIVRLLDRTRIDDPSFRAAVAAIHAGDVAELARLLDAEPRLLRDRIVEPAIYRRVPRPSYFLDPKLFWFVANNPIRVPRIAPNVVAVAAAMIERGVDRADLDYALELTLSGTSAREGGVLDALARLLLDAGARPTPSAIAMTAAHRELDAIRALVRYGIAPNAAIFAALGDGDALRVALSSAARDEVQTAFGLAAINGHVAAARVALEAGADPNAFLPVHAHGTALHQAATDRDGVPLIDLLLRHGARRDVRDTLWGATPLEWAVFGGNEPARVALLTEV